MRGRGVIDSIDCLVRSYHTYWYVSRYVPSPKYAHRVSQSVRRVRTCVVFVVLMFGTSLLGSLGAGYDVVACVGVVY